MQLRLAGGGDKNGDGLIAAVTAVAHRHFGFVVAGRVLLKHGNHVGVEFTTRITQHFDGVIGAGEFDFWGRLLASGIWIVLTHRGTRYNAAANYNGFQWLRFNDSQIQRFTF